MPVRPLSISHQGQFPAVTISFNLAQGVALGQATDAMQQARWAMLGVAATLSTTFQGTAQAFQQSLSTVPLLILAALVVVYLILGMLYESYIHPLTILSTLPSAGVGALLILMAVRLRLQPDRADRHHPPDRHRQEERHHDGGLRDRRRARRAPGARAGDPAGRACCASGRS